MKRCKRHYDENLDLYLLRNARRRAARNNHTFELTRSDIIIPKYCPILHVQFQIGEGKKHKYSATVDRLDNDKGYTKDNIVVVTNIANTVKNNGSVDDLSRIINFLKSVEVHQDKTWVKIFEIMNFTVHKNSPALAKLMYKKRKEENRAKLNREFTITTSDIIVPNLCPALGIPLFRGKNIAIDNSPTVDRLNNNLGYQPSNIAVLSKKANLMKNNVATLELEQIYIGYKNLLQHYKEKTYGQ